MNSTNQIVDFVVAVIVLAGWVTLIKATWNKNTDREALRHTVYFAMLASPVLFFVKICAAINPLFYEHMGLRYVGDNLSNFVWTAGILVLSLTVSEYYDTEKEIQK